MTGPYLGKYRGRVVDDLDPLVLGRILVEVAQVPAAVATWAMPCVPYAGFEVGFYFIPPIGANVWVEFEGGDPNFPIWVGCFWSEGEVPLGAPPPFTKIIQTATATLILNDLPGEGGVVIETRDPAVEVPASLTMDAAGIQLLVAPASLSMSPEEGVTIEFPPTEATITEEGVNVTTGGAFSVEAGEDLSLSAAGAAELEAAGDVSVSGGVGAEVSAGADLAMSAGGAAEVSAGGDVSIAAGGAAEMTAAGDVSIAAVGIVDLEAVDVAITAAATEVTSAGIALTGLTESTGDLLIDGQQPLVI